MEHTYNHTVLPNLDMVSDRCCFDNGACANMDVISDLHGVVVEVPSIGLVRRPLLTRLSLPQPDQENLYRPYHATFANQTIPAQRNNNGMAWTYPSQVSSNDC